MTATTRGRPGVSKIVERNPVLTLRSHPIRFNGLPEGDVRDPEAYKTAIARLPKGSAVISELSGCSSLYQALDLSAKY